MTLVREGDRIELVCDAGDEVWPKVFAAEDFEILLADAKAEGWRASRIDGEWRHRCPSCIADKRLIKSPPTPAAGLFGETLPVKRKPRS